MNCPHCQGILEFASAAAAGVGHCQGCGRAWWVERFAAPGARPGRTDTAAPDDEPRLYPAKGGPR